MIKSPIKELEADWPFLNYFPTRIANTFLNAGIKSWKELAQKTIPELLAYRGMGANSIDIIEAKLLARGMRLKEDPTQISTKASKLFTIRDETAKWIANTALELQISPGEVIDNLVKEKLKDSNT